MVVELLRAGDELLAARRREEEAAVLVVAEELDRKQRQPVRFPEPAELTGGDVQLEQAVRDVRVAVQVARAARPPVPVAAQEMPVLVRERAEQELAEPPRRLDPLRPAEPAPGLGERGEREPVPGGDRLVVA